MTSNILLLPGDGIGTEIVAQGRRLLEHFIAEGSLDATLDEALLGGCATDAVGDPYPEATREKAHKADAILLGAVGGPKWDSFPREQRPERGLLRIRADLGLFANLRPAMLFPALADASSLRPELVAGLDIMIVRELTGGIYFGSPRGIEVRDGERVGFNTQVYKESEIRRIVEVACDIAKQRGGQLCSVDKANVLEASELWREVAADVAKKHGEVTLSNMLVDNAAMQLVRTPKQFDVIVTGNLFGDILSDIAAMLTGSIGMLPSASLNADNMGIYEPVHGSAPDIAGQGIANPLATLLSTAMLLRYSLDKGELADRIESAVSKVLESGLRTGDIAKPGEASVGTEEMASAVIANL